MPSCEKCWDEAARQSFFSGKDHMECYLDLMEERKDNPCTPEQQAGAYAQGCPECKSITIHQHVGICMNPKCIKYGRL